VRGYQRKALRETGYCNIPAGRWACFDALDGTVNTADLADSCYHKPESIQEVICMLWLLAVIGIPILVILSLFFSAANDFWQIMTFRISFSRLFDDLAHVLAILVLGALAELFSLYMLLTHIL
jgi:hypothetical protein